jgi:hypothetical protein
MRLKVETLLFDLNVFLWENPGWAKADIVVEYENGGRIYARRVKQPVKGFDIEWETKDIYVDQAKNFS